MHVTEINELIPESPVLYQNYPNPFNPETKIRYDLPENEFLKNEYSVTLSVYDILGNEISRLVNAKQKAGKYEAVFYASDFASGIYFVKLFTGDTDQNNKINNSLTRKMLLLK